MQIEQLKQAAQNGDAKSQFLLGRHFFAGHPMPQDFRQAMHWYQKAADQNYSEALLNLGKMHEQGQAGAVDLSKAVDCYRRAADLEEPEAQYMLGLHYQLGEGVPRDDQQAFQWCRKAADNSYASAQFMLGTMYAAGQGVDADSEAAMKWYRTAAMNGDATAQYTLGTIDEKMSLPVAQEWYKKAADQDYPPAQYRLGQILLHGDRATALAMYTGVAFHLQELIDEGYLTSVEAEIERCLRAAEDACNQLEHEQAAQWAKLANMIAAQSGVRAPHLTPLLVEVGRNLHHGGYNDEAESIFVEALALLRNGSNEALCAELFGRLGQMYANKNDFHKAEQTLREAITTYETMGVEDFQLADLLCALGVVYIKQEKQTLAVPMLRKYVTLIETSHGANSSALASALSILGSACLSTGYMLLEAEQVYKRVLEIFENSALGSSTEAAAVMEILASLMDHEGRPEEAEALRSRAAAIARQ
jgi:TPR repeat protein